MSGAKSDGERRELLERMKQTWFDDAGAAADVATERMASGDTEVDDPDEDWANDGLADWVLAGGLSAQGREPDAVSSEPSQALRDAYASFEPDVLLSMFPDENVALDVAEQVDDLVPDPSRAESPALTGAFEVIAAGLDRCAVLKQIAGQPMFEAIAREKLQTIRSQKSAILGLRDALERRQRELDQEAAAREKEDQAWREAGVERPTGFAAMFAKPGDAAAAKRREEDRRKLLQETRDYERKIHEKLMKDRRDAMDKQHEQFLRMIQGRRY
ncbi:hypothetical protein [Ilumatobacter nonamiensis]|uniref:hypothetical protein n=1 Tax=Ilumatobacter nonamiensis TaxID=467093 RepID=UPI0011D25122|nr:hypothetical protein [Ilumatobacter nonamiensis]